MKGRLVLMAALIFAGSQLFQSVRAGRQLETFVFQSGQEKLKTESAKKPGAESRSESSAENRKPERESSDKVDELQQKALTQIYKSDQAKRAQELVTLKEFKDGLQQTFEPALRASGIDLRAVEAELNTIAGEKDKARREQMRQSFVENWNPYVRKAIDDAGINLAAKKQELALLLDLSNSKAKLTDDKSLFVIFEPKGDPVTPKEEPTLAPSGPSDLTQLGPPFRPSFIGEPDTGALDAHANRNTGEMRVFTPWAIVGGDIQFGASLSQILDLTPGVTRFSVETAFQNVRSGQTAMSVLGYASAETKLFLMVQDRSGYVIGSTQCSLGREIAIVGGGSHNSDSLSCNRLRVDLYLDGGRGHPNPPYYLSAGVAAWAGAGGFAFSFADGSATLEAFRIRLIGSGLPQAVPAARP